MSKEKIIKEAARLFAYRGLRATSMFEIAVKCGDKPSELKRHFSSKRSLVTAIIDDFIVRNERHLRFNPKLSPDVSYEIKNFFQLIEHSLETFNPFFLWELKKYYNPQWQKITSFRDQRMIPYLNDNIRRGVQQGCYEPSHEELSAEMYFVKLHEIITHSLPINIVSAVQMMNKLFYNGLVKVSSRTSAGVNL